MNERKRVVVVGLGYVGLPLAVTLARNFETWGFDIDDTRVKELTEGYDRTNEIGADELAASSLKLTSDPDDCPPAEWRFCCGCCQVQHVAVGHVRRLWRPHRVLH